MKENQKVWFITGVSRGLGRALASAVLGKGDVVIGTTRDGSSDLPLTSHRLHILPLELPSADYARTAVVTAHALYGRLDVIVNNAGYGMLGAIEETGLVEVQRIFDVNFFGPLQVIQAVLPYLRAQHHGHIVNVSSISGLAPRPGSGIYAATKFALEGLSESLAQEVAPFGVRVTLVEPGAFRTDFLSTRSIHNASGSIHAYAETNSKIDDLLEIAGKQPGDPTLAAQAIITAVEAEAPPLHLILGADALERAHAKLRHLFEEMDQWKLISLRTGFTEGPKPTLARA